MREEPGIPPAGLPVDAELPDRVGVLVLGGGLAGAAALLAAAEAGQYAVLLEKTDGVRRVDRALRRAVGVRGHRRAARAGHRRLGRAAAQGPARDRAATSTTRRLVDLYCERQLDTYRWLKGHGVRYGHIHAASGQSAPRSHPTDTTAMLRALFTAAGRLGARLVLGADVMRILHDGTRVTGVLVDARRRAARGAGGCRRARHRRLLPGPRDARAVRARRWRRPCSPAARGTTATAC